MQRAAKNKTIWLVLLALASVLPSPVIALSGLDQGVQNRVELFLRGAQNGTGRHPFEPAKRVENYDRRPGTASESPVAPKGTVTVSRVQGGRSLSGQPGSRQLVDVDEFGDVSIQPTTLNVSIGDSAHAEYFRQLRPGSRITTFEIPKWMDDFIQAEAIPQAGYRKNPLNQGGLAPKIVDPNQPGRSLELPSIWAEWLQENAIRGSGRVR